MVPTDWLEIKETAAIFCERGSVPGNAVSTHTWKRRDLRDEREASGMRQLCVLPGDSVGNSRQMCSGRKRPWRVDDPLGFKYSPSNQFVKLEASCYMSPIKGVNMLGLV